MIPVKFAPDSRQPQVSLRRPLMTQADLANRYQHGGGAMKYLVDVAVVAIGEYLRHHVLYGRQANNGAVKAIRQPQVSLRRPLITQTDLANRYQHGGGAMKYLVDVAVISIGEYLRHHVLYGRQANNGAVKAIVFISVA